MSALRKYFDFFLRNPRMCSTMNTCLRLDKKEVRPFSISKINFGHHRMKALDEESIVQFLNTCTLKDLRSIEMFTQDQVADVWNYRTRKGLFSSLSVILSLLQMDDDTSQLLCSELLSLSKLKTFTAVLKKYFSPTLSLEEIGALSSITGLEICLDSICFAHLTSNLELMSWNHIEYPDINYKTQHPPHIFEMAHSLVQDLPKSDMYVLEQQDSTSKRFNNKNKSQQLFITQLQMSILHLLNGDFMNSRKHRVFFARKYFVKKTFHLLVGGEGVSGQHLVKNLENDELPAKLMISSQQKHHFFQLPSDLQRERYTNALLLPLAFLKLGE